MTTALALATNITMRVHDDHGSGSGDEHDHGGRGSGSGDEDAVQQYSVVRRACGPGGSPSS